MINEVVELCRQSYNRDGVCVNCDNDCKNSCEGCLREIHRTPQCARKYNCPHMCNWYVCQNMHKYASEIFYLLGADILGLRTRNTPLNICSVGCGPATELIAVEEFRQRRNQNLQYTFKGFDFNEYWNPIQVFVKSLTHNPDNVTFMNTDVFDHYRNSDDLPNMIILNYMLSDMLKMNFDGFNGFLENIYCLIRRMESGALLINDINHYSVRDFFGSITTRIKDENHNVVSKHFHFEDSQKGYWRYGKKQENNTMTFNVPENIAGEFNPNTECHSAQVLIMKPLLNQ